MRPACSKLLKIFLIVPVLIASGFVDGAVAKDRNPCASKNIPIRKNAIKDSAMLKAMSEKLWGDTALGTSGMACGTCHPNGAGLKKEPFPKHVRMTGI